MILCWAAFNLKNKNKSIIQIWELFKEKEAVYLLQISEGLGGKCDLFPFFSLKPFFLPKKGKD